MQTLEYQPRARKRRLRIRWRTVFLVLRIGVYLAILWWFAMYFYIALRWPTLLYP